MLPGLLAAQEKWTLSKGKLLVRDISVKHCAGRLNALKGGPKESKLLAKEAKLVQKVNSLRDKVAKAEDDMTGRCPILDEPCDRIKCDSNQVGKWKRSIKKGRSKLAENAAALVRIDHRREAQKDYDKADLAHSKALADVQATR